MSHPAPPPYSQPGPPGYRPPPAGQGYGPPPRKRPPTWLMIVGGIFGFFLLIGIIGAIAGPAEPASTATQPASQAPAAPVAAPPAVPAAPPAVPTTPAPVEVTLPEVGGRNGQIVMDELTELGLTNVTTASADANATVVLLPANWTVVDIEPGPGSTVETDDTVVVTMTKK